MNVCITIEELSLFEEIQFNKEITYDLASRMLSHYIGGNENRWYAALNIDKLKTEPTLTHSPNPNDNYVYESEIYKLIQAARTCATAPLIDNPAIEAFASSYIDIDYFNGCMPSISVAIERNEFGDYFKLTPEAAIKLAHSLLENAKIVKEKSTTIESHLPTILQPLKGIEELLGIADLSNLKIKAAART